MLNNIKQNVLLFKIVHRIISNELYTLTLLTLETLSLYVYLDINIE